MYSLHVLDKLLAFKVYFSSEIIVFDVFPLDLLGMTIVLTIITLMANAFANVPKTSYPKAIGVFLSVCFMFNFAGLVENLFAATEKKKENPFSQQWKKKKMSN